MALVSPKIALYRHPHLRPDLACLRLRADYHCAGPVATCHIVRDWPDPGLERRWQHRGCDNRGSPAAAIRLRQDDDRCLLAVGVDMAVLRPGAQPVVAWPGNGPELHRGADLHDAALQLSP